MLFNGNRFRYTASEGMGRQESPQLIERKTQVDTDAQETSRASKYFLEDVALKSLNYHCIHIDQLELIQPTGIGSTSTCKQFIAEVYHASARYAKPKYRRSAKPMEAANLRHEWQILAPNPCLTGFWNLYFVGTIPFTRNFCTTLEF